METNKFAVYGRVSTTNQGVNGLGIESQIIHIKNYVKSVGGEIIETFVEAESGTSKKSQTTIDKPITIQQLFRKRPKLIEAAKLCNVTGCTLIAYDIERLGRSTFLISYLQQVGINFLCSAYPNDAPMMLNFRATIGQEYADKQGQNTSKAIQAKIAKGFKWGVKGKLNLTDAARQRSIEVRMQNAREDKNNIQVRDIIKRLNANGDKPLKICSELNRLGYTTATGKKFQVPNIYYHLQIIRESR